MKRLTILIMVYCVSSLLPHTSAFQSRATVIKLAGVVCNIAEGAASNEQQLKTYFILISSSTNQTQGIYYSEITLPLAQEVFHRQFDTVYDLSHYLMGKEVVITLKNVKRDRRLPRGYFGTIERISMNGSVNAGRSMCAGSTMISPNLGMLLADYSEQEKRRSEQAREQANQRALATLPINEQAVIRVKTYFETKFTRCGDMYESQLVGALGESGIYYYKNPRFIMTRISPLTEADKLNGITWSGEVEFRYGAVRAHIYDGNFERDTPWRDYEPTRTFIFHVWKIGSSWNVASRHPPRFIAHRKIQCITGD
jgi:hypothetical protein